MVSAMKKAGLDFEYKYYNKEGHGQSKDGKSDRRVAASG